MTASEGGPSEGENAQARELLRIVGDQFHDHPGPYKYFVVHPVFSRPDVLDFLRSVPTGTPFADLAGLAAAYVTAHPELGQADESSLPGV